MIDELLVKYLAEEATPPEQTRVEQWITEKQENRQYFEQFQAIWLASQQLAATHMPDEKKAWRRFQRRIRKEEHRHSSKGFGWWRVAAVIVLVAGAAWITSTVLFKGTQDPEIINIAANDQVKKDTLPDGTLATINKHSAITYPSFFKGKTRNVKLQGEAFFNVKPDKRKAFVIEVNDVTVKVLGTSFNVRSQGDSTEVIVETGIVEVSNGGNAMELKAGERAVFSARDTAMHKIVSDDKLYNYYVSRTFVCDNTPLWKLVEKLNEAYEVDIRIERSAIRRLPLTVTFDDESLDTILEIISQTLLIKATRKGNEIILY